MCALQATTICANPEKSEDKNGLLGSLSGRDVARDEVIRPAVSPDENRCYAWHESIGLRRKVDDRDIATDTRRLIDRDLDVEAAAAVGRFIHRARGRFAGAPFVAIPAPVRRLDCDVAIVTNTNEKPAREMERKDQNQSKEKAESLYARRFHR